MTAWQTLDWTQGSWRREGVQPPTHRIVVVGDWYPRRGLERLAIEDPASLYGDLLSVLREADLRIVNVEAPLSERGAPVAKDGPNFRAPPASVAGLAAVPFDVACLANNHIMDFGREALEDTLEVLGTHGIRTVGAGLTPDDARAPLVAEVGGFRVGVVNFCEGEDGTGATCGPGTFGWEPDRVVRAVTGLRREADVVLAIAHAGREYVPVPPPYVQRLYRSLAEAGADLVVGHHPHVPQGVEIHRGVPIVYGLGNFVFLQRRKVFRRRGSVLSVELGEGGISGLRLIPYRIDEGGVHALEERERAWLFGELAAGSEILREPGDVREVWDAVIDSRGRGFWRQLTSGGVGSRAIRSRVASMLGLSRGRLDEAREATRLRNRFLTPAHHHFMADGLARLRSGRLGGSTPWAQAMVERWATLEESDLPGIVTAGGNHGP